MRNIAIARSSAAARNARINVERGGHALHQRLLSELLASQRSWRVVAPGPVAHGEAALAVAGAGLS